MPHIVFICLAVAIHLCRLYAEIKLIFASDECARGARSLIRQHWAFYVDQLPPMSGADKLMQMRKTDFVSFYVCKVARLSFRMDNGNWCAHEGRHRQRGAGVLHKFCLCVKCGHAA